MSAQYEKWEGRLFPVPEVSAEGVQQAGALLVARYIEAARLIEGTYTVPTEEGRQQLEDRAKMIIDSLKETANSLDLIVPFDDKRSWYDLIQSSVPYNIYDD